MITATHTLPTLADLQQAAESEGMHLIHDGREIVVSPIVPPGWFRIAGHRAVRLWDEINDSRPLKEAA